MSPKGKPLEGAGRREGDVFISVYVFRMNVNEEKSTPINPMPAKIKAVYGKPVFVCAGVGQLWYCDGMANQSPSLKDIAECAGVFRMMVSGEWREDK
jgi:hypothetical protein